MTEITHRLDNLWTFLNEEGWYTKANTAFLAKEKIASQNTKIEQMREALKEAGDYLEAYKVNTNIDLGDASDMPFVDDTLKKIDAALEERG